jgi:two-component system, sensor histidine kinase
MREVMDSLEPQAQAKSLTLRFEVTDSIPLLQTDGEKLRRVLINLVGNAVKFTPHGEVLVRMNPTTGERIQIEVQDSGIGIAADKFETIFQPFRQVDAGISREYGGTGLGLAITRSLIEMLGGQICVRSELGHGSVFTVTLPFERMP